MAIFISILTIPATFSTANIFFFVWGYTLMLPSCVLVLRKQTGKYSAIKHWLWIPFLLFSEFMGSVIKRMEVPNLHFPSILRKTIKFLQFILFITAGGIIGLVAFQFREQISKAAHSVANFLDSYGAYLFWGIFSIAAGYLIIKATKSMMPIIGNSKKRKELINRILNIIKIISERPKTERSRYIKPDIYHPSREKLRFNKWRKSQTTSMNVFQFLDAISYADTKYSFLALAHIREHNLLQAGLRSERVVEVFIQHLENALNTDSKYRYVKYKEDDKTLQNAPSNFVLWLLKYQRSFGGIARFGIDFLDAASQFLEEIKKNQTKVL